jgi:hypothetical protein
LKLQKATAEVIKSEVHNINAKKYMYRPSPRMDVFKMNNNVKKFTSFSKEKKNENNPGSNTDYLSNGKNKNKDKFFNTKCLERFNGVNGNILGNNNNNKLITNPNSNTNNSNSNSNTNNLTRDRDNLNMNMNNEAYNNVNSNSNKNLLPNENRINSGINSGHISLRKSLEFNRERAKTFTNNKEATSISNTANNLFNNNHNHNQNIIPSTNNPHNTNTNSNPNSNVKPVVFKKLSKDINSKLSSILATKAKRSESNASASGSNIKTNE